MTSRRYLIPVLLLVLAFVTPLYFETTLQWDAVEREREHPNGTVYLVRNGEKGESTRRNRQ